MSFYCVDVVRFLQRNETRIATVERDQRLVPDGYMSRISPLRVLLVEDSALTAEQLCDLIKTLPYSIDCNQVATEEDALASVEGSIPDAVVLDLRLKEGNGFSVLRELATVKPKPRIIVLTNYALPKYRELALLSGADYFLDKARDFEALNRILESMCEQRGGSMGSGLQH
jgi:DNA-binding NarL/FixJ family response regulator